MKINWMFIILFFIFFNRIKQSQEGIIFFIVQQAIKQVLVVVRYMY